MVDRLGQQFGHYRLVRLLGQGGYAEVYLGEHLHLGTQAAIKVLRTQLEKESIEAFCAEARTVAHLLHLHIVRVLDFGVEAATPFLVMEYAPNGTLRQLHPRGQNVPIPQLVSSVKQVAAALQYAHDHKLTHGNVKPENLLVGHDDQILLSDFGITVLTQSAHVRELLNQKNGWDSVGMVAYMAPEQIQDKALPASDQYALATVVYEWLTGAVPFTGSSMEIISQQISAHPVPLREQRADLSPEVEQVVLTALAKDPQQRFQRVEAFAHALELALLGSPATAVPSPQSTPPTLSAGGGEEMGVALITADKRISLGSSILTMGQAPGNQVVLNDQQASSYHAVIHPEGHEYTIMDLGSSNGTFVNEQPLARATPHLLRVGDRIRIGQTTFAFEAVPLHRSLPTFDETMVGTTPSLIGQSMTNNEVHEIKPPDKQGGPLVTYPQQPASPLHLVLRETLISPTTPFPSTMPGLQPLSASPSLVPPASIQLSPPPLRPKPFLSTRTLLIMLIVLVLLFGSVGTIFVLHNNQVSTANTHATATAQQHVAGTALARQQATGTALVQQHATATAQVTSSYPPFFTLAFFDPLTGPSIAWTEAAGCHFSSTGLQVSIGSPQLYELCTRKGSLDEMAYQATMTITQGDCGGLLFRVVDQDNFGLLVVCSDGTYNVGSVVSNQPHFLFANARANPLIHAGLNQRNVLAVSIRGNVVDVFINGQVVTIMNQTVFTKSLSQGVVGLIALAGVAATSVTYTNATAWTV